MWHTVTFLSTCLRILEFRSKWTFKRSKWPLLVPKQIQDGSAVGEYIIFILLMGEDLSKIIQNPEFIKKKIGRFGYNP